MAPHGAAGMWSRPRVLLSRPNISLLWHHRWPMLLPWLHRPASSASCHLACFLHYTCLWLNSPLFRAFGHRPTRWYNHNYHHVEIRNILGYWWLIVACSAPWHALPIAALYALHSLQHVFRLSRELAETNGSLPILALPSIAGITEVCVFSYSWFFGVWIKLLYTIITQMYNFFTIVATFATFIIAFAQVRRRLGNTKLKVSGLSFCISLALH